MRKQTLKITDTTEISLVLETFKNNCLKYGMPNPDYNDLVAEVERTINDLVMHGRKLKSIGSQFRVQRVIEANNLKVSIDVDFGGKKPSTLTKLWSLFVKEK